MLTRELLKAREAAQVAAGKSLADGGLTPDAAMQGAALALISGGVELWLGYQSRVEVAAYLRKQAAELEYHDL